MAGSQSAALELARKRRLLNIDLAPGKKGVWLPMR
tara:strand:+ start:148 stop:252 length:105 start_codon:yes stop_codon:yes gene_type:complete